MKTRTILYRSLLIAFVIVIVSFSITAFAYPSGAPAGYTGSPGDAHNCTSCHGGTLNTIAGLITSDIPTQGYTPGTTYTITATASGAGNKGFEISPQDLIGTLLGTLAAGSNNHLTGSNKYVTHNASGTTNPATWSFSWTAPSAGTGTVTFYGAFAITKNATQLSTLVVNEYVAPLTVSATATPGTIIAGETSQLNASASGGTGTYTYSWTSSPAGFTSTLQNPVVSPTVTTQYNVVVTSGTATAPSNTTVTVLGILNVVASASPQSISPGQSSQLNAAATGGTGTYTYSWTSTPAGFTSTSQNPVVSPTVTTQYFVTVTSGTQTGNSNTTVTVTANPMTVTATATPGNVCLGQTSQLNAATSGGSGTNTYSWTSIPAGFSSSLPNPMVQPLASTQYIVAVNDGFQTVSDTTLVTVSQPATASAGNDTSYCDFITQFPIIGTAANYSTVLWTTGGDGTFSAPLALSGLYFPGSGDKTAGSVTLTLTATPLSPCSVPASSLLTIGFDPCTGISDPGTSPFAVSVSPNPSNGAFTVHATGLQSKETNIILYDFQGKILLRETASGSSGFSKRYDLSEKPKGIYFLKVVTENGSKISKVILQ
jgi:hypothetical protein